MYISSEIKESLSTCLTESQSQEIIYSNILLKVGSSRAHCPGLCPVASWVSPSMETTQSLQLTNSSIQLPKLHWPVSAACQSPSEWQHNLSFHFCIVCRLALCLWSWSLKMLNSIGSTSDPWGTLLVTGLHLDFLPPVTTLWGWQIRQLSIHLTVHLSSVIYLDLLFYDDVMPDSIKSFFKDKQYPLLFPCWLT